MPFTKFGAPNSTERSEGDGPLPFEISGNRRDGRFTGLRFRVAVSCAVHNAQGSKFNEVTIGRMHKHGSQFESLFVAISGTKTAYTLFFLEEMSDEDILQLSRSPSIDLYLEMERLRKIEASSINLLCAAFANDPKLQAAQTTITQKQIRE